MSKSKGYSQITTFLFITLIIITATTVAFIIGQPFAESLDDPLIKSSYEKQMSALDTVIRASAHGDINFTTTYSFFLYGGTRSAIEIDARNDIVRLVFRPKLYGDYLGQNLTTDCSDNPTYYQDPETRIPLRRFNFGNPNIVETMFLGGSGAESEIVLCYDGIDIIESEVCAPGTQRSRSEMRVTKTGANSTSQTLMIGFC
ncbi:MAG: hypothetical protein J4432_03995 [DPANN group archaeon]|nr:hypothetical protein [DPANN group archaeon]